MRAANRRQQHSTRHYGHAQKELRSTLLTFTCRAVRRRHAPRCRRHLRDDARDIRGHAGSTSRTHDVFATTTLSSQSQRRWPRCAIDAFTSFATPRGAMRDVCRIFLWSTR